jgi:hypothetical protein
MSTPKKQPFVQAGEKYLIRFPEGLRDRIASAAKDNSRSMNAEIVARIERTFAESERDATIEQTKALLSNEGKALFEDAVIAALRRYQLELAATTEKQQKSEEPHG